MDSNDSAQRNQIKSLSNIFKNTPIIVPNHFYKNVDISNKIKQAKNKQNNAIQNTISSFAKFDPSNKRAHFPHNDTSAIPVFSESFNKLFDNQKDFGKRIFDNYVHNSSLIHTLAIAPTQSGKTGSMLSIIFNAISHPTHAVPIHNIYIFTPHSSREWLLQTRERFPPLLHNNIFHRNNIKQLSESIQNKQNVLLILDEVQIAFKLGQTTFKLFNLLGMYNPTHPFTHDIKIVSFTATPNQLPADFHLWKQSAIIQKMDVPKSYISHSDLLQQGRLLQMEDLTCFDQITQTVSPNAYKNIRRILPFVINMQSPKFHIIRTPRANLHLITLQNFQHVFKLDNLPFRVISETTIKDLDSFIQNPPSEHTFIFIKDKLRCAKTLHKQHLGVLYERFVQKPITDSIVQGLAGRLTGYHDNTQSVVFTHLPSIYHYYSLVHNHALLKIKRKPSAFFPF